MRRTSGESALATPGVRSGIRCVPAYKNSPRGAPRSHSTRGLGRSRLIATYAGYVTDPRRALPGVDRVLRAIEGLPHELLAACARQAVDAARERTERGDTVSEDAVISDARDRVDALQRSLLRPVINATGVIVHTNLGRAPLSRPAIESAAHIATGYSNL